MFSYSQWLSSSCSQITIFFVFLLQGNTLFYLTGHSWIVVFPATLLYLNCNIILECACIAAPHFACYLYSEKEKEKKPKRCKTWNLIPFSVIFFEWKLFGVLFSFSFSCSLRIHSCKNRIWRDIIKPTSKHKLHQPKFLSFLLV